MTFLAKPIDVLERLSRGHALLLLAVCYSVVSLFLLSAAYAWNRFGDLDCNPGCEAGDFFAIFPAPEIARWFGKYDSFYLLSDSPNWSRGLVWGYGPMFHLFSAPLFLMPSLESALKLMFIAGLSVTIITYYILVKVTGTTKLSPGVNAIIMVGFFNFFPLLQVLSQRNIELFELLLIVLAMLAYSRNNDWSAGILVGLAAMTKFLPGILIPYFILKRRWNAVLGSVLTVGAVIVITQFLLGWQNNRTLREALGDAGHDGAYYNQAISGVIIRLMKWIDFPGEGLLVSRVITVLLVICLLSWIYRERNSADWMLHWSVLLMAVIFLVPHNQTYYLCFLVIPFVLVCRRLASFEIGWRHGMLVLAYLAVGWPLPLRALEDRFDPGLSVQVQGWSIPFLGSVVLLALLFSTSRVSTSSNDGAGPVPGLRGRLQHRALEADDASYLSSPCARIDESC